jgi:Zn-dependent protease
MADFGVLFNIVIAVFNLIPIPPLDGGRVLTNLLPARNGFAQALDKVEPWGLYLVMGLALTGLLGAVIGRPVNFISSVYASLFSLLT